MLKFSKIAFSGSIVFAAVAAILFFSVVGCEQILDEALKQKITVEEPLFDAETHEDDRIQKLDVATGISLSSTGNAVSKAAAQSFPVTPVNGVLFSWVCSESGGELRGVLQNKDTHPVTFNVHFGNSEDFTTATLIGSVSLAENESRDFVINGPEFEAFFAQTFESRYPGFYIFLSASESNTVNLLVNGLAFVLQPSHSRTTRLGPVASLAEYSESGFDVTDIELTGTIFNYCPGDLKLLFCITPVAESPEFDGMEIGIVIAAGTSLNLAEWSLLFTPEELAELASAVQYLSSGAGTVEFFMTTESAYHVEMLPIVMSASVSVVL